jgi:hypothetical protein
MATPMRSTSAIAFASVTLASFLSVSVWAFPAAADSKAPPCEIYAAAACKPGLYQEVKVRMAGLRCKGNAPRGPDLLCPHPSCQRGFHWDPGVDRCVRD